MRKLELGTSCDTINSLQFTWGGLGAASASCAYEEEARGTKCTRAGPAVQSTLPGTARSHTENVYSPRHLPKHCPMHERACCMHRAGGWSSSRARGLRAAVPIPPESATCQPSAIRTRRSPVPLGVLTKLNRDAGFQRKVVWPHLTPDGWERRRGLARR